MREISLQRVSAPLAYQPGSNEETFMLIAGEGQAPILRIHNWVRPPTLRCFITLPTTAYGGETINYIGLLA